MTIQGTLAGERYIQDVLQLVVASHFDNQSPTARLLYVDDDARPHRARAGTDYLQQNVVPTLPWPAMSPDLNLLERIWNMIGRR